MTRRRLSILDDEAEFAEYVRKVAVKLDFETQVFATAHEFMENYPCFQPDIIVLDMVMPEFDGIEVVQWLASNDYAKHLIVVTGYYPNYLKMAKELAEARGLRSVTRLTKPVKPALLREALNGIALDGEA